MCTCATIESAKERGKKKMRMERLAVTMPRSTAKAFRRYAQIHDMDLCMAAKEAVTENCRQAPGPQDLMDRTEEPERMFISMPNTAMRLLELWSENTGISKTKLMEWAIRKLTEELNELEEKV